MLDRPNLQTAFNLNGILLLVFNAFLIDLLVIGYGGHSDLLEIGDLLSKITAQSFFKSVIVAALVFIVYILVFKQPLIWVLSRIYFVVVWLRIVFHPHWRVGNSFKPTKEPSKIALRNWREFCRYQLSDESGAAVWTATQNLSVATFFLFLVSLASPLAGFQSLGYRLLPDIQESIGIPVSLHWIVQFALICVVCYICSNGMLALLGDHEKNFTKFYNRNQNLATVRDLDGLLENVGKAREYFEDFAKNYPTPGNRYEVIFDNLEGIENHYRELKERIEMSLEERHNFGLRETKGAQEVQEKRG